nr:hypothetical protein [Mucilaginibacter sp. L294]
MLLLGIDAGFSSAKKHVCCSENQIVISFSQYPVGGLPIKTLQTGWPYLSSNHWRWQTQQAPVLCNKKVNYAAGNIFSIGITKPVSGLGFIYKE